MSTTGSDRIFDVRTFHSRWEVRVQSALLAAAGFACVLWEALDPRAVLLLRVPVFLILVPAVVDRLDQVVARLDVSMDGVRASSLLGSRQVPWDRVAEVEDLEGPSGRLYHPLALGVLFYLVYWRFFGGFTNEPAEQLRVLVFVLALAAAAGVLNWALWHLVALIVPTSTRHLAGLHVRDAEGNTLLRFRGALHPDAHGELRTTLDQLGVPFTSVGDEET